MIPRAYVLGAAGAVLGVLALGLWVRSRGVGSAAGALAGGAVRAVEGATVGAVTAAGQAVGVPATDRTECERALAEGRTWDASFACPARDFIGGMWRRATTGTASRDIPSADYDEAARLARRYPAPAYAPAGGFSYADAFPLGVAP